VKKMTVVGECMVELSGPDQAVRVGFGGDTLNAAIYAQRVAGSGISVGYITRLGSDTYSASMRRVWVEEGLDCAQVSMIEGRTAGLYAIETDGDGERSFTYWRGESPAKELFLGHQTERELAALAQADLIYVTGITLAVLSSTGRSNLLYAMHGAKSRGAIVGFDANYRAGLWDSPEAAADAISDAYAASSIVFASDPEHLELFGEKDRGAISRGLEKAGVSEWVMRDGAEVISLSSAGREFEMAVDPVAQPVDTTGAGDAFSGAYLARRLSGDEPRAAAQIAMAVSARVIQHAGAVIAREHMADFASAGIITEGKQ